MTTTRYAPYPLDSFIQSSGIIEGHVNRIRTIKRQMYGRAPFALLGARILLQPQASRKRGHNP